MRKRICVLLAVLMVLLAGCGGKSVAAGGAYYAESAAMAEDSVSYEMEAPAEASPTSLPQNRKWIINMDISAETENLDEAVKAVEAQITTLGGYLENQSFSNSSISSSYRSSRNVWMNVRIPAEKVDEFVHQVSGVTNVVSSSRSVEDITLAYSDTEGRVNALKTEEARLLELMERAENMSDLLEIEARLTEVRYQLERYTSQLRRYDNQVDYATISLSIREVQRYSPVEKLSFWQRTAKGFRNSIEDLGDTIVGLLEWLIVDLPWLVFFGLIAWGAGTLIKKRINHRKKKKAAQKEQESA